VDRAERARLTDAVRRLGDGDRSVLPEVYRGLLGPVRSIAIRMLGPGADADDVTEEAIVEVVSRASELDPEGDAVAWAMTIGVWRARTERKKRTRRREELLETAGELVASDPDPEAAAIAREAWGALEAAVGQLSEREREALDAVLSGAPLSAAFRKRKERLLVRLRRMLVGDTP
jgi:RNA polymerase sigma factor (sigma-70 family)